MQLFLTGVLPFLAHDHASAVAFLTCRHHNFHASIIPEFLIDEERVKTFCETRQQKKLEVEEETPYKNLYNLFVQTPLMQFSPSLMLRQKDSAESILKPLLATKYFTRTLQRCSFSLEVEITNDLLQGLSKVQSLTKLDLNWCANEDLEIIVNSFLSLVTLSISEAPLLEIVDPKTAISMNSPPPTATKTLRNLTLKYVDALFATKFLPNFPNLRKLELSAQNESQELDLLPLSSSLPLLKDMSLTQFTLAKTESLKNLVHLSNLEFIKCCIPDLSFLAQENSLPELRTLRVYDSGDDVLSTPSFVSLSHAPNLHVLDVSFGNFDNDCLQYLENMVHLRKLDVSCCNIVGDCRPFKTLMQNLFQLEELNISCCYIKGNQGAFARALYSSVIRLRVLNLSYCSLVDDGLNGIGALKNTLEVLNLGFNNKLTNEALVHCKDLVKLKVLNLHNCHRIDDLSPLKDCSNLEELDVSRSEGLTDDSFEVFSEEPNSFPNIRKLDLSGCLMLTGKVFEHLSKNNNLVYQLKELKFQGRFGLVSSSATAQKFICQLKGLRRLKGVLCAISKSDRTKLLGELMQSLKNLEEVD